MPTILLSTRANMNCQTNEEDRKEYPGMSSHSLVVLIHCKTGWIESRQLRLSTGEVFLYFHHKGYNSPIIMQGVALPVSKEAQKALIAWRYKTQKFIIASFRLVRKIWCSAMVKQTTLVRK